MKLYAIKNTVTKKIVPDVFFATKQMAKMKRDELGKDIYCVTYGPDHRKYK